MFLDGKTIERNLALMNSLDDGGMVRVALKESHGGNSPLFRGYLTVVVWFCYDALGEIVYFGNPQNIPPQHKKFDVAGFHIALNNLPRENGFLVLEILDLSQQAMAYKVIAETVLQYNKKFGFALRKAG